MVPTYGAGRNSQLFRGFCPPQVEVSVKDRLKLRCQNGKLFLRKPLHWQTALVVVNKEQKGAIL
jgi:hypothetical protein